MALVSSIVLVISGLWTLLAICVLAVAVYRRHMQRGTWPTSYSNRAQRVLLIRPCAGAEPQLLHCLTSVTKARASFQYDVVFVVSEAIDPAVADIREAIVVLERNGINASMLIADPRGPNRKASSLATVTERVQDGYDVVINADSNVDLNDYDLDRLVGGLLDDANCAAVWAPPFERGTCSCLGNRASAAVLANSLHGFALLAGIDPKGLVGKLFAIRRAALQKVGGFATSVDYLGEDSELAQRLGTAGYLVKPAPQAVCSLAERCRLGAVVQRYSRWMLVIKAQRPSLLASYPLLFFNTFFILILCTLVGLHSPLIATLLAITTILIRVCVGLAAQLFALGKIGLVRSIVDIWLADLTLLLAFIAVLPMRAIEWRGQVLTIDATGKLNPVAKDKSFV